MLAHSMSSTSAISCDAKLLAIPMLLSVGKDDDARKVEVQDNDVQRTASATEQGALSKTSTILAVPAREMLNPERAATLITIVEDCNQDNDPDSEGIDSSTMSDSGSSSSSDRTLPDTEYKRTANGSTNQRPTTRTKNTSKSASASTSSGSSTEKRIQRKRIQTPSSKTKKQHDYKYVCSAKEDHGQPIFGCQFRHQRNEADPLVLATVGSNRISVYECLSDGKLKMLQVFADPDNDEIFYCCAWTDDDTGKPLLAAAGARGIIRIISAYHGACIKHFLGHGHAINDLTFHPKDANLLLSASKDHSLRMYNIKTNHLVAVFGGVDGHRDEVLAADIDITGSRIVSCGMDHSLKMWKLNKPEVQRAISASYTYSPRSSSPFPTAKQNFPDFSTRDVHRNYVDCTKWFGDFILSKSCENSVICWKAGKPGGSWDDVRISTTETSFIHRFEIRDCEIWFIRFSMDYWKRVMALGNQNGKTYIYDLRTTPPSSRPSTILSHPKCTSAIRQTALSRDGRVLVCVCDDATIWRWDLNPESQDDDHDGAAGSDKE